MVQHIFRENLAEGKRAGRAVQERYTQQHEHIAYASGHESLDCRIPRRFFSIPETDQQVGTQAHDLPTDEHGQQVVRDHQGIHPEGEQAKEREETRVHRFNRWDSVLVTLFVR